MTDEDPGHPTTSRRAFLGSVGASAGAVALGAGADIASATQERPTTSRGALLALLNGNKRYRQGRWTRRDYSPVGERRAIAQEPFAAILTCADSRISPPLVFDVERGNVFCAHVAGNSLDTGTLGSIEYAVAVLKVRLVMVLGHTDCGAVKAALGVAAGTSSYPPETYGAIGAVVDAIVPAVRDIPAGPRQLSQGITANARAQARDLRSRRPIIAPAADRGDIRVVAAVYDIATGAVKVV